MVARVNFLPSGWGQREEGGKESCPASLLLLDSQAAPKAQVQLHCLSSGARRGEGEDSILTRGLRICFPIWQMGIPWPVYHFSET